MVLSDIFTPDLITQLFPIMTFLPISTKLPIFAFFPIFVSLFINTKDPMSGLAPILDEESINEL